MCRVKVLIDTKVKGEVVVDVVVKLDVKEGDVDVVIENVNVDERKNLELPQIGNYTVHNWLKLTLLLSLSLPI